MSKDPAFLFYTNDFLSGISDLTMEERGQFITLLCLQHQKGRLTEKMINISCGNATADVLQKFIKDENGLFYNERLDLEIKKRAEHAEKQRKRAVDGWKKRKANKLNATANATALPLEDVNVNVNEDKFFIKGINSELNEFFKIWNKNRIKYGKKVESNLNKLDFKEKQLFSELINQGVSLEDMDKSSIALFKQKDIPNQIMISRPKHLFENLNRYLDAYNQKQSGLYKFNQNKPK